MPPYRIIFFINAIFYNYTNIFMKIQDKSTNLYLAFIRITEKENAGRIMLSLRLPSAVCVHTFSGSSMLLDVSTKGPGKISAEAFA